MSLLDRAHDRLQALMKRKLEINPGLEAVERRKEFARAIKNFKGAFDEQIEKLLDSGMFAELDTILHPVAKADSRILTESDELEIFDVVGKHMEPLGDQNDGDFQGMFADFLILVFVLGGQDFLNKHNIPATFDLKNQGVIDSVKAGADKSIKGVDETTRQWIKDQIVTGREAGLSNADIADAIREKVPDTYKNRAERIVRTETSDMVGKSEHITAQNNGASHKEWVTVAGACDICAMNEGAGFIGIDQAFPSGDMYEPAHPNCRCLVEYQFTPFMGSVWHGQ